jgi:hypothetical protein
MKLSSKKVFMKNMLLLQNRIIRIRGRGSKAFTINKNEVKIR